MAPTLEQMRQRVALLLQEEGYSMLGEYKTARDKIELECPNGHRYETMWTKFQEGRRCHTCMKVRRLENIRQKEEKKFESSLADEGYVLLSEYANAKTQVEIQCPSGHTYKVQPRNFTVRGHRCRKCSARRRETVRKQNAFQEAKIFVESKGYELVSGAYVSNTSTLELMCPQGHKFNTTWSSFRHSGSRCRVCFFERNAEQKRTKWCDIVDHTERQGYLLVSKQSKYENVQSKLKMLCPKGHAFESRWGNFKNRQSRCPVCARHQSKAEREMASLFGACAPVEQDRTQIKPYELDLYFPNHQVAVEYCGLFWHSEAAPGGRITSSYHRNKLDQCATKGIRLLTIFEDEWLNHKEICTSRINNALNRASFRIYARNTAAKQIPKAEAKEFLNRTHLQGYGRCKIAFGLYHNNKLVSVMTWGSPARHHTAKGKKVLEMKRFASELDTIIVGGASKLLKLGLQYAKDNNYDSLKSYCDLRWGTGNLYKKLGFIKTHETKYTPHYTDFYSRFRNQVLATNKKKEKTTEAKKAEEKGLYKIYDCGHSTWEYLI